MPNKKFSHPGLFPTQTNYQIEKFADAIFEQWEVSAVDALFRSEARFMPGSISLCWKFWESVVLVAHPLKDSMLSWLKFGVRLEEFLADHSEGEYNGVEINSHFPQIYREQNHVSIEFHGWVSSEISDLVKSGVLIKWEQSMGCSAPVVIAPLLVVPSKPRLNIMMQDMSIASCPYHQWK